MLMFRQGSIEHMLNALLSRSYLQFTGVFFFRYLGGSALSHQPLPPPYRSSAVPVKQTQIRLWAEFVEIGGVDTRKLSYQGVHWGAAKIRPAMDRVHTKPPLRWR